MRQHLHRQGTDVVQSLCMSKVSSMASDWQGSKAAPSTTFTPLCGGTTSTVRPAFSTTVDPAYSNSTYDTSTQSPTSYLSNTSAYLSSANTTSSGWNIYVTPTSTRSLTQTSFAPSSLASSQSSTSCLTRTFSKGSLAESSASRSRIDQTSAFDGTSFISRTAWHSASVFHKALKAFRSGRQKCTNTATGVEVDDDEQDSVD